MNDNTITVSGNLIANPERRRTKSGHPMLTFRVASNHRYFNTRTGKWEEGGTNYYDVVAFRNLALNAADSLEKGMGVHIQGNLRQRRYTRQDGSTGMSCEIEAKSLGVDLTFVVAKVWRRPKADAADPWTDRTTGEVLESGTDGPPASGAPPTTGGAAAAAPDMVDPEITAYDVNRDHDPTESYPAIGPDTGAGDGVGTAVGAGVEPMDSGDDVEESAA
ncbi:MAG TPA: single-stranded DNA-binding protein [Intrasporangiaceae bacterium]|nr:single-stranded DNA-binding protein [Intrasporangiaceae bacterium]